MKESPILFSGAMVRAILAGSKTQTRRVVKPQRSGHHWQDLPGYRLHVGEPYVTIDGRVCVRFDHTIPQNRTWDTAGTALCPYGAPGARMWVRETFALEHQVEHDQAPPFSDGRPIKRDDDIGWIQPHYRASDPTPELAYEYGPDTDGEPTVRWKPSIHMPRWACRITLEITGVRVERLQDISVADARAEGIVECYGGFGLPDGSHFHAANPRESYWSLWETINGPGSVEANPWVWCVEFKRAA